MDWMLVIVGLIGLVIGLLIGRYISKSTYQTKPIGTLRIDTSDSDGPYMFLELDKNIGDICLEEYVRLRVSTESYLSQK